MGSNVKKGIQDLGDTTVTLLVYALIIGSIVGATAFSSLTILNVTSLTAALVVAFGAIVGFVGIVGTFIGLRWLIGAIRGTGKNDNITNMAA